MNSTEDGLLKRSYNFIDMSNQKFGKLYVTEEYFIIDKLGKKIVYWKCVCDCGKKCSIQSRNIRTGHTRSCGCLGIERATRMAKNRTLPKEQSIKNKIYHIYKMNAKNRGIEFSLDKEQFGNIILCKCFYCGIEPSRKNISNNEQCFELFTNGVDRFDNSKGYTALNCVPCCTLCNRAKDVMSREDFLKWVSRVYHHNLEISNDK